MKKEKELKATHWDVLDLSQKYIDTNGEEIVDEIKIRCAVLEDGTAMLSERGVNKFFGNEKSSGDAYKRKKKLLEKGAEVLPVFMIQKNLKPFVLLTFNDEAGVFPTAEVYKIGNAINYGYRADLMSDFCQVWTNAFLAGALRSNQIHKAQRAIRLNNALAKTGLTKLIYEVTGYDDENRYSTSEIFKHFYLQNNPTKWEAMWQKDIYDYFYLMFNLVNDPAIKNHPWCFSQVTIKIYERLFPIDYREFMEEHEPQRLNRFHQYLTDKYGKEHLRKNLEQVLGILKATARFGVYAFYEGLEIAFPKPKDQLSLPYKVNKK